MVIVAVAFPLASKVTELELSDQVGPPACAGWTAHPSIYPVGTGSSAIRTLTLERCCHFVLTTVW